MAVRDWIVDYVYLLRGGVAIRRRPPKHYRHYTKENMVPVILLSGLFLKWHFLRHLGNKISRAGHPTYIVPSLGRNLLSIPWSARLVRELLEEHSLSNVVVVGHSKGGLIGKYLLAHHNNDRRIKAVIAIATPFTGSRLARTVPHNAFRELTHESETIQKLQKTTGVNKRIYSLIPAYDNHVWSDEGSYLKGATNTIIPVRGHHRVVFDKNVQAKVMKILDKLSGGKK